MEISDQTTCLDPYFASFEESLSTRNYKPDTLKNYCHLLRRYGHLLEAEGLPISKLFNSSATPPMIAVALIPDEGSEPASPEEELGYQYQWWTVPGADAYSAICLYHQYIYIAGQQPCHRQSQPYGRAGRI